MESTNREQRCGCGRHRRVYPSTPMKTLIILNDPPYGTERSYNGLRLAGALVKHVPDQGVTVFLMGDGVFCAKKGQKTPEGFYNIERMLHRVTSGGGQLLICGTC